MGFVVKDRVKETTSTTGTGTITLSGASDGFRSFASVLSDNDITYYALTESGTGEFEVGLGTFNSSGTTLERTTILSSSNSDSAINLTDGEADVFITYPADKAVILDGSDNQTNPGLITADTFVDRATTLSGATPTANVGSFGVFNITLSAATTFSFTGFPSSGTAVYWVVKVKQDASGNAYSVSWPSSVKFATGAAPTLSNSADEVDVFTFYSDDGGTTVFGFASGLDLS
jgi:hypothetical protein